MRKLLVSLGFTIATVLGIVAFSARFLPLNIFTGDLQKQLDATPVGDSTLVRGRAVFLNGPGTDILKWHWCPAEGFAALCFQVTGHSGFFQGVVRAGPGHFEIDNLHFSRVSAALLGIGGISRNSYLRGEMDHIHWGWRDSCAPHGLVAARGKVVFSDPVIGDREVLIEGDGKQSVAVGGDILQGRLKVGGNRMSGRLKMALDGNPGSLANVAEVNVNQSLGCG